MTSDPTSNSGANGASSGGQGGQRFLPSGQRAQVITGERERRRRRHVARARLREARARVALAGATAASAESGAVADALKMLHAIVREGTEQVTVDELTKDGVDVKIARRVVAAKRRQAQLAAGDILFHHREMAKLDKQLAGAAAPDAGGGQHLHIHLQAPSTPEAERELLDEIVKAHAESAAVTPPKPTLPGGPLVEANGNGAP